MPPNKNRINWIPCSLRNNKGNIKNKIASFKPSHSKRIKKGWKKKQKKEMNRRGRKKSERQGRKKGKKEGKGKDGMTWSMRKFKKINRITKKIKVLTKKGDF